MVEAILKQLAPQSSVAVVTMTGTCCPVTLAHIQLFIEARRLLLDGFGFDTVVGGLSLNPDSRVGKKLATKGLDYIKFGDRRRLVQLAIQEHAWLQFNDQREGHFAGALREVWPQLIITHYMLNGADDVVKYRKWRWEQPQLVMCRPGSTKELLQALHRYNVDTTSGNFIVGPELEDISSTHVRDALVRGDRRQLLRMLHPDVARWCWDHGPYRPVSGKAWDRPEDAGVGDTLPPEVPRIRVVRRTDGSGVTETLLRSVATSERSNAVWIHGRPSVRNGCFVEELRQDNGFSWVRTLEHFSKSPVVEGFVNSSYLHDDCPATVLSDDATSSTMLRKIATPVRSEAVWVDSRKAVRNGETVQMLFCQADFTWVQTSDGTEGFLKTGYLKG